jgi:hypothetical protein
MKFTRIFFCVTTIASVWSGIARADSFDHYTNQVLASAPEAKGATAITELTAEMIAQNDSVLPGVKGAMVVVYTNDKRWCKLLMIAARHKIAPTNGGDAQVVPIVRIERYQTYREASERAIQAEGKGISLFAGFHFHLDLGQVVPEKIGGDIRAVEKSPRQVVAMPVGNAKMYLLTKPIPEAMPPKSEKFAIGAKFEPTYFNGAYKLYDDGRRSGVLRLKVNADNDVTGTLISDRDGREYEVRGSIAKPNHRILFTVQFPQTVQSFDGLMFTGDGKAIAGTNKMQEREASFYAIRSED